MNDPVWQCNEPWTVGRCLACRCFLPIGHRRPGAHRCICGSILVAPSSRLCNHTEEGDPYCGAPECDIDFCPSCGYEYSDPCPRHDQVDVP